MRRRQVIAGALAATLFVAGCQTQHEKRLEKAAGATAFRIQCSEDLWNRAAARRTGSFPNGHHGPVKARVINRSNGIITVELTGPQLVDLLEKLDHSIRYDSDKALAKRMYNAVAPKVDALKAASQPGQAVPQVVIDDRVGGPSAPAIPTTPSPDQSN